MRMSAKVTIAIALIAASFLGGFWYRGNTAPLSTAQTGSRVAYYACPMHPQYHSDRPGDCPSCGMRLEAVYSGQAGSSLQHGPDALLRGAVQISSEKQQLLGVRTANVSRTEGATRVRTVGRVSADERKIYYLNATVDGWIEETFRATTGAVVTKDEPLATFYSPQGVSAQMAYLNALGYLSQFPTTGQEGPSRNLTASFTAQTALDGLRALGMTGTQIEALRRDRQLAQSIRITSPAAGIVLARNIASGKWCAKGTELYRIADLGRVWILADVFEIEARYIRPGQTVNILYQGKTFTGKASEVPPQFDPATRTLKVRFEADNPGYTLRPDMFVEVELPVNLPAAVTVPADAVVDSGLKKTVYVAKGDGYFEPRTVVTGWRLDDQVEIVKGLAPGERIVISGNFLLDSESRMRMTGQESEPAGKAAATFKDPVCGMDVEPAKAANKSVHDGKTYYFCSQQCKKDFDKNPQAVLASRRVEGGLQ